MDQSVKAMSPQAAWHVERDTHVEHLVAELDDAQNTIGDLTRDLRLATEIGNTLIGKLIDLSCMASHQDWRGPRELTCDVLPVESAQESRSETERIVEEHVERAAEAEEHADALEAELKQLGTRNTVLCSQLDESAAANASQQRLVSGRSFFSPW